MPRHCLSRCGLSWSRSASFQLLRAHVRLRAASGSNRHPSLLSTAIQFLVLDFGVYAKASDWKSDHTPPLTLNFEPDSPTGQRSTSG
eukprot:892207-Rhodomonas_salina.1